MTDDDRGPDTSADGGLDELVRPALAARAATATVDPAAWAAIADRCGRVVPGRVAGIRRHGPVLALAAASVALVVLGALLRPVVRHDDVGTGGDRVPTTAPVTVGPVPGPEDPGAGTVPGTTAPPPPPAAPGVRDMDLANATYPGEVCPGALRLPGDRVPFRDGQFDWSEGAEVGSNGARMLDVVYVDVTGDGREEVAVRLRCGRYASDDVEAVVAVLAEDAGRLVLVDLLATSGAEGDGWFVVDPVAPRGDVTLRSERLTDEAEALAVAAGQLRVRWRQGGQGMAAYEAYGQGYDVDVTYRWDGSHLRPASVSERRVVPHDAVVPGTLAYHAIRRAGVWSMTLPLTGGPRICSDVFSPTVPAEVTLVDGGAVVPGAGGPGVDGSVRFDDVSFGPVTGGPREDAAAVVRCEQQPGKVVARLALIRLDGDRPVAVDWLLSPAFERSVQSVDVGTAGQLRVTWASWRPGEAPDVITYRWDGAHLVPR